jgi:hypothetical protein
MAKDKLTARQAAEILGYHVNHVYRLLRSDVMGGEQFNPVWMIDPAEAERIKRLQDVHGRRRRRDRS